MINPNFLNGKNRDDLAPITTLIFPSLTPLQIISFFFLLIPECQTAGLIPKNSINFCSNCPVNPISGNKIKPWKPFLIMIFKVSKYTIVFPEPVVPCKT